MYENDPNLQALRDAQQGAARAWQQFMAALGQGAAHVNPALTTTLLLAYRDTAQRFADLYPDHPFPKTCVEQANLWLKELGTAQ